MNKPKLYNAHYKHFTCNGCSTIVTASGVVSEVVLVRAFKSCNSCTVASNLAVIARCDSLSRWISLLCDSHLRSQ